jgi:hypothetical protein
METATIKESHSPYLLMLLGFYISISNMMIFLATDLGSKSWSNLLPISLPLFIFNQDPLAAS